jgi:hypothetical protein
MQTTNVTDSAQAELWLPTGQACRLLGCSADTLKRYAKKHEFLLEGEHWYQGPFRQSPMVWNVSACKEAIRRQGRLKQRQQPA